MKKQRKIQNTSQKDVHPEWVMGGNPGAIEKQEAAGQQALVASDQLPRKCNHPRGANAAEIYYKMGIKVFTTSKGDDLFLGVSMPEGWKKEATDHSMWNKLVDDKGRVRATFFYKAAFYDRDAFINFKPRFNLSYDYPDASNRNARIAYVEDGATSEKVWESPKHSGDQDDKWYNEGYNWLKANYPDYEDILAYW